MKKMIPKSLILLSLLSTTSLCIGTQTKANVLISIFVEKETDEIKKVIYAYIAGGDEQSVSQLQKVMHDNYRVIINDPKENQIKELDKSTYLDFIEQKKFGGIPRKVEIESISISNEVNATVKLKMSSSSAIFFSQFSMVKSDNKWWIIQDMVQMELK